jgi:hypothetical protein
MRAWIIAGERLELYRFLITAFAIYENLIFRKETIRLVA